MIAGDVVSCKRRPAGRLRPVAAGLGVRWLPTHQQPALQALHLQRGQ